MTVTFARRTSSGRYISYSRESNDLVSEIGSGVFLNYTVQIPSTPDNQPMDPSISQRVEEQYVLNSFFTGGFNSVTRAHLMDKVIDSDSSSHPQMAGAGNKGFSSCAIPGCDGKVMSDERAKTSCPASAISRSAGTVTWTRLRRAIPHAMDVRRVTRRPIWTRRRWTMAVP